MDIQAIERVLDKRSIRGATDESLIFWLDGLKKIHEFDIAALDGLIDAIKQSPIRCHRYAECKKADICKDTDCKACPLANDCRCKDCPALEKGF